MVLTIDTTLDNDIEVTLMSDNFRLVKRVKASRQQAEKLLPLIEKIMSTAKINWSQIEEVRVQDQGGSFTSLRIGILTANALAFALGVPVTAFSPAKPFKFPGGQAVKPLYRGEPNIGTKRPTAC